MDVGFNHGPLSGPMIVLKGTMKVANRFLDECVRAGLRFVVGSGLMVIIILAVAAMVRPGGSLERIAAPYLQNGWIEMVSLLALVGFAVFCLLRMSTQMNTPIKVDPTIKIAEVDLGVILNGFTDGFRKGYEKSSQTPKI